MATQLEENVRLFKIYQETRDQGIRNRLVTDNMALVQVVSSKYKPYSSDYFQEGCIGLITAVETYKIDRNVPFANYACFCIERSIQAYYNKMRSAFLEQCKEAGTSIVYLDAVVHDKQGNVTEHNELIFDEVAENELNAYIEENELSFISESIIKPCIAEIAARGQNKQTKVNLVEWQRLEFLYIMDMIFIDSQKDRANMSSMAKQLGLSVTRIKGRHENVMELVFERLWTYMTVDFNELLVRLRGDKKIPHKLLVVDPGKTTGYTIFIDGKLASCGHVSNCYDDNNINVKELLQLIEQEQPDFIVYEDYKVYGHKLQQHNFSSVFTARIIGAIEAHCQIHSIRTHKQMATAAKGFVTDEKLKEWGLWQTGMRHARDAIRHACYFLLFYNRGKDIV